MVVDSFSERLNSALEKEGFPPKNKGRIQLLAEMVGLTHRGASKWLSGETCPPAKKYADLAKKLNVREEWLRTGELPIVNEAIVPLLPALSNPVAVYRAEDFLSQSKKPIQYVNCDLVSKGELFAIKLDSEAMSPRFPTGTIVLLDNKKLFQDGDFVLVNFENYPVPIFRQLLIAGSSLYLHAHNPKFDRLLLTHPQRILGVMIQAILSFA
jgi:SOS-response transcriptional repressor LexA